jgi:chromosome segregation ATPase
MERVVMTQYDPQETAGAERETLAALVARFSADRDGLAAAIERLEAGMQDLAARLDAVADRAGAAPAAAELGAVRFEMGRLESLIETLTDQLQRLRDDLEARAEAVPPGAGDDLVADVRRLVDEVGRQAAGAASLAAEAQRAGAPAIDEVREVRAIAVGSGERAGQALSQTADLERRSRDVDAVRAELAQLRDDVLRRVDQAEARLGVRVDSMVAGAEAESRTVREETWDRLASLEQRLLEAEQSLAGVKVGLPQSVARALEGIAGMHGDVERLQQRLTATDDRLTFLEQARRQRAGFPGLLGCVRDEIVAAVMTTASLGAVAGRLVLSLVR